jgi:DNA-binding NtrC family response regulator
VLCRARTVLVADSDPSLRRILAERIGADENAVAEVATVAELFLSIDRQTIDLVVLGPIADGATIIETVRQLRERDRTVPVVLIVRTPSDGHAIAAVRAGVRDYFTDPWSPDEIARAVKRCLGEAGRPGVRQSGSLAPAAEPLLIGSSPAIDAVRTYVARVAPSDANVLITGETGTGKELIARLVHAQSARRARPLVSINCAAIPDSLLESELFGHERGAFTGAHAARVGQLQLAHGGTVFLDEIGDMDSHAQAKILRAVEIKEISRLGGRGAVPIDVRFVAATNQDLEQSTTSGRFRRDLYFRLHVAHVHLPPLRERRDDIPPLVDYYVGQMNRRFGDIVEGLTPEALERLVEYPWPGNVRELRNLLEITFIGARGPRLGFDDLPAPFRAGLPAGSALAAEKDRMLSALSATNWNKSRAAEQLHWSRMTLYRKMAKYHVVRSGPKPGSGVA